MTAAGRLSYGRENSVRRRAVLGVLAAVRLGAPAFGALVGGAAGIFIGPDDLNLGKPIWK